MSKTARYTKIQTDPKVYAVDLGSVLRWVTGPAIAQALYGANWQAMVEDISDAFFTNYVTGLAINQA